MVKSDNRADCGMEWISSKQSGLDIYSANLISIGFDGFHVVASYLESSASTKKEKFYHVKISSNSLSRSIYTRLWQK